VRRCVGESTREIGMVVVVISTPSCVVVRLIWLSVGDRPKQPLIAG
jgi:hypothetical protein